MKWLRRLRERNSAVPVDKPYTYRYTLGELPLPQPWRQETHGKTVHFVPTEFILTFLDRGRISLLRNSEAEQLKALEYDMLTNGQTTPIELWLDPNGKLRMQEGHHRMSVIEQHLEAFPRVPVIVRQSPGRIKSYGRSVIEEFETIMEVISK